MRVIPAFFKQKVEMTLAAANKRRASMTAKKQNEIGSTVQRFAKILHDLEDDADQLEKELGDLRKIFIHAAKAKKKSLKAQLEEAITVFKESRQKWASVGSLYIQIKNELGDNPISKKFVAQAKDLEKRFKAIHEEKEKILSDLTHSLVPVHLTTHDTEFFRPFLAYIVGELKKLGSDADIQPKKSKYIPGIGPNGEIRWARYMPLVNVPTIDGDTKNIYLVVCITFLAYSEKKGKLEPMMVADKRGVEKPAVSQYSIGMLNKFVDPIDLSKVFYKVASLQQAKDTLAYLAEKNNLYAFGKELEGTVKERLEKVAEKLKVLNKDGVKVTKDKNNRNFITVKVPKEMADTNALSNGTFKLDHRPTQFDIQLYMDVQRYAGLPSNSRYNFGRLRLEKVEEKGSYVNFLYRVHSVTIDMLKTDELAPSKKITPTLEKDYDEDIGSNTAWDELLRQRDMWLSM